MKYKDEKRIMFRDKNKMDNKLSELRSNGCKIIMSGYIASRSYRNFGYLYGIIFRQPIINVVKK